jgi:thiamine pyrophosphate-dependent acetolactate synthase large subunit-like protein
MLTKDEVLAPLAAHRGAAIVVTTMGAVRPWALHSSSDVDFASADSGMGHAADLALGIALARPARQVICLNGDGSMMMSLGTLVLAVAQQARNFVLFVLQNDRYELTGNQPVPGVPHVDFTTLARGAGFTNIHEFDDPGTYRARLAEVLASSGPTFVVVRTVEGHEPPLARGPQETAGYLRESLADSAHRLRVTLRSGPDRAR